MSKNIYNSNYRRNLELYWQQFYPNWQIPNGFHVHHIKPKATFDDPNNPKIHHPSNLIALHPDDHISIHKCRGDKVSKNFICARIDASHTTETKIKMSKAKKGKLRPLKDRRSISVGKMGQKNPKFSGFYCTPYGKFESVYQQTKVGTSTLWRWCKNSDSIVTIHAYKNSTYLQSLGKDILGSSFKDIGFWFEPV